MALLWYQTRLMQAIRIAGDAITRGPGEACEMEVRAPVMGKRGEANVGLLPRERFGKRIFKMGFSIYTGTVAAARDWREFI